MAKKKVALVLSGGVSLGAYIAGAIDELLTAFACANESASGDQYEIDIISGASAGATTGALVAHGLLYRKGRTALHDVWVEGIDMADLLSVQDIDTEPMSVLTAGPLVKLAASVLFAGNAGMKPDPASFCADELILAMTITNTLALPYSERVAEPASGRTEKFVQARNAEQETFRLNTATPIPYTEVWQRIALVAQASAAIPFVFPLVHLSRQMADDEQYILKPDLTGEADFWYYDGGTFNNLPVDLAWNYAKTGGMDDRVIVVVNPWRPVTGLTPRDTDRPGLLQGAMGLLSAMRNESTALRFAGEVLGRDMMQAAAPVQHTAPAADGAARGIAGVGDPPVELLGNFALVMPTADDKRLHGNHLHALAAFLDRSFREYDFRRGAADAQKTAHDVLKIQYDSGRPADFYLPDDDKTLPCADDLQTYAALGTIKSTKHPDKTVLQVFEDALGKRVSGLVRKWNPPGPDLPYDLLLPPLITHLLDEHIPGLWTE
ncbi:MAG: patatin-like phospholipase family protein [Chloroflexia bacterium]